MQRQVTRSVVTAIFSTKKEGQAGAQYYTNVRVFVVPELILFQDFNLVS
jgi:hypothetical protein